MEMAKLHEKAKQANITILCEMGLDPGLGITFTCLPSFVFKYWIPNGFYL
jgi:hypothetical protein